MKFVAASSLRLPRAWKTIHSGKAVITNRGKPIAIILPITDATFESVVEQVGQIEAITAMRNNQSHAKDEANDRMSDDQIQAIIADVRKKRHTRRR